MYSVKNGGCALVTVKLADLAIGVDNKYTFFEKLAASYITDEAPIFTVSATESEIEEEGKSEEGSFSEGYLESIVIYRKIAEKLPMYGAFVFNSAVLSYRGGAYAFTARSGVGKTTHTRLWIKEFAPEVHYLNGDKPIVRFVNGAPIVFGTPYRGKEGYGVNESNPLKSIAFVERATENSACVISAEAVAESLVTQVYMPRDPMAAINTLRLVNKLAAAVKLVSIKVNMDAEAAHVARNVMYTE